MEVFAFWVHLGSRTSDSIHSQPLPRFVPSPWAAIPCRRGRFLRRLSPPSRTVGRPFCNSPSILHAAAECKSDSTRSRPEPRRALQSALAGRIGSPLPRSGFFSSDNSPFKLPILPDFLSSPTPHPREGLKKEMAVSVEVCK